MQEIRLPEEDPATFHFLVAFLYEGTFRPIRPASAALGEFLSSLEHPRGQTADGRVFAQFQIPS